MTKLDCLAPMLDWKLLYGSHDFPGPDGGTCINEAAIVAAGFEYRKIDRVQDCPPCFSRPIAALALRMNDRMPKGLRQELLLPFVTRLAGTADTPEVEELRTKLIAVRLCREILAPLLRQANRTDLAEILERAELGDGRINRARLAELRQRWLYADAVAVAVADAVADADADAVAVAVADAVAVAVAVAVADAVAVAVALMCGKVSNAWLADTLRQRWEVAVSILDEAIRIGKQGNAVDHSLIKARLEIAKTEARERSLIDA
jgi:hypothetical protein